MASPKKRSSSNTTANTRRLEKLIRETVRSEISNQQAHRRATDNYSQRLQEADAKVTEFIQQAITETTRAYRISINSFLASHVAAFVILFAGILLLSNSNTGEISFIIAIVFIIGSIIWIISLQNRSLAKSNRSLVNNLAKLNIIFAGYIRQIHQVDAVFESLFENSEISSDVAEKLLNNLQDAMSEAMSAVSAISMELEE
jgi:polyhydroxyalkanoate synthesis regulator phasin